MKIRITPTEQFDRFILDIQDISYRGNFVIDPRLSPEERIGKIAKDIMNELTPIIEYNIKAAIKNCGRGL